MLYCLGHLTAKLDFDQKKLQKIRNNLSCELNTNNKELTLNVLKLCIFTFIREWGIVADIKIIYNERD